MTLHRQDKVGGILCCWQGWCYCEMATTLNSQWSNKTVAPEPSESDGLVLVLVLVPRSSWAPPRPHALCLVAAGRGWAETFS